MIINLMPDDLSASLPSQLKYICFPDGQPHFEVTGLGESLDSYPCDVHARIASGQDLLRLACLADCLHNNGVDTAYLNLWWVMGARMDREINGGTLTARVVAHMINDMAIGWDCVYLLDPHSDVLPALIDRSEVVTSEWLVRRHLDRNNLCQHNAVLVAPDAGAAKKVEAIGRALKMPVLQALKHRDVNTGELSGFSIQEHQMTRDQRMSYVIVDDICDGGGTFAGLAETIHQHWQTKGWVQPTSDSEKITPYIHLVVSHGIFSKGFDLNQIDRITTTNSYRDRKPSTVPSWVRIENVLD